jgi:hypothetical protein
LDYVRLNGPIDSIPAPKLTPSEQDVMRLLSNGSLSSVDILAQSRILRIGTLRNALTRLRRFGWIQVAKQEDGGRAYALTDLGRTYVPEIDGLKCEEPSGKTAN